MKLKHGLAGIHGNPLVINFNLREGTSGTGEVERID